MRNGLETIALPEIFRLSRLCLGSLLFLSLCTVTGCDSFQIRERSPGSESFSGVNPDEKEWRPLAYVKSIKILSAGAERNANPLFVTRVRDHLRETNLFREVVFEKPPSVFPYVEISFVYSEVWAENQGLNFAKTMLTAASLGLLAPVMVATADYACDIQIKIRRPDAEMREYRAHSSGEARSSLNLHKQKGNLVAQVITNDLNSVMSQLIADKEFYRAKTAYSASTLLSPI
jgi:hypothetical protein